MACSHPPLTKILAAYVYYNSLSNTLPDPFNAWRHTSTPLEIFLQITQLEKLLEQVWKTGKRQIDGLGYPRQNSLWWCTLCRGWQVHNSASSRQRCSAPRWFFSRGIVFTTTLYSAHWVSAVSSWKTRRLVIKIAAAADILPESAFDKSGIELKLLECEAYSGGDFQTFSCLIW